VTRGQVGDRLNVEAVTPLLKPQTVTALQAIAAAVAVDDAVLDYAVRIVRATRSWPGIAAGTGPRGGIALVRVARAAALMAGRDYVVPDDVKRLALPCLRHRVTPTPEMEIEGQGADALLRGLLEKVDAPRA
jgi:MoxR-like ATPase